MTMAIPVRFICSSRRSLAACQMISRLTALRSGQDVFQYLPGRVGEAEIAPLRPKRQLLVIQAEDAQHGRVNVVNLDRVGDRVVAEVVGFSVGGAGLHVAA